MRSQDYIPAQKFLPLRMHSQKIQSIRIQDQRFLLSGSCRKKPLCSLTACHRCSKPWTDDDHVTPGKKLFVGFFVKPAAYHCFRKKDLQRNPVLFHSLDLYHSRSGPKCRAGTQISSTTHSCTSGNKKYLSKSPLVPTGITFRKQFQIFFLQTSRRCFYSFLLIDPNVSYNDLSRIQPSRIKTKTSFPVTKSNGKIGTEGNSHFQACISVYS